ncbi:MAG: hypothetical protein DRR16_07680 [Candidatus Parabeggiatoa sp. nov. 3]|nr:MAG: hypothetical protein DRR00_10360 [Gammaproteobacteria bacterium]RKZ65143.1 MAG: hypothetical protein DRQ99_13515 [Gammaproteobacteria bacterium]RKZ87272.1 MAG: hypothetical protein DRR16_07680 [Gammaproteobacteria bacterium]
MQIKIIVFHQTFRQKPDDDGELIFDVTVSKYEFSLAILNMLETLLSEYGVLGYKKQWVSYGFPLEDYRHLCLSVGKKTNEMLIVAAPLLHRGSSAILHTGINKTSM